MPIKAEREGSGPLECQRREIKIPRKRACRGFYFSRPIRAVNTSLSAIRVNPINLTRWLPLRLALRVNLWLMLIRAFPRRLTLQATFGSLPSGLPAAWVRAPAPMLGCG